MAPRFTLRCGGGRSRFLQVLALSALAFMTRGSLAQFWGGFRGGWGSPRAANSGGVAGSPYVSAADGNTQPPVEDWLPPEPNPIPTGPCVAAFDFDGVLRAPPPGATDLNVPGPEALSVVQASKNAGYKIAICSANDSPETMKLVLGQRLDPSTFTSDFFNSPAFQMFNDDKSVTLRAIISYFNTSPSCVMFFDDGYWNMDYAKQVGVIFIHTVPNAGITYNDFQRAQQAIPRYCNCQS